MLCVKTHPKFSQLLVGYLTTLYQLDTLLSAKLRPVRFCLPEETSQKYKSMNSIRLEEPRL
jgi:hypothetical protein